MKPPSDVTHDRATPVWAPRVRQHKIRQLYEDDAKGIYDEELINDVGYALLARCLSFIAANEATQGTALCPWCSRTVLHGGRKGELLRCECGWELTWGEYFQTIQQAAQWSRAGSPPIP